MAMLRPLMKELPAPAFCTCPVIVPPASGSTARFVLAAAAVVAPVPPLLIGTAEESFEGASAPDRQRTRYFRITDDMKRRFRCRRIDANLHLSQSHQRRALRDNVVQIQ